jgi:hypothetical protein
MKLAKYILITALVTAPLAIRLAADEPAPAPAPTPAPTQQLFIYSGTLQSLDLKTRTIIVDSSANPQKFVVPTDAQIIVKDKPKASLGDLMVGNKLQIKYTDDDGVHVAHEISILGLKVP